MAMRTLTVGLLVRPSHRGGWCGTMGGGVATGTTPRRRPSESHRPRHAP